MMVLRSRSAWSTLLAAVCSLALGVGVAGCTPGDSETEEDAGTEGGDEMDTSVSFDSSLPDDFEFAESYEMRFTAFEFTDESPGQAANPVIERYLDQAEEYPIVVLLHIKEIDPEKGTAKLRGGAGLKVDRQCVPKEGEECEYKWDPEGEFIPGGGIEAVDNCADRIGEGEFPGADAGGLGDTGTVGDGGSEDYAEIELDPRTGEVRGGLAQLDFIGTTQFEDGSIEKFTLPINDLVFRDAYLRPTEDGSGVEVKTGRIRGYITEEAAEKNKVQISPDDDPIPIADVIAQDLNYDADQDGTLDSWCMEATFSAGETNIVEE